MEKEVFELEGFGLYIEQKRLWLLQKNSSAYRVQCSISLEGKLEKDILKKALHQVITCHEILRTVFRRLPGMDMPLQDIVERMVLSYQELDMRDLGEGEQESKVDAVFREQGNLSFDFEQGPLVHFHLLVLSSNRHVLMVNMPAICADAWSMNNLIGEISKCYNLCLEGNEIIEQRLQDIQVSSGQNELVEEDEVAAGKEYWNKQQVYKLPDLLLPFEKKYVETSNAVFHRLQPNCIILQIKPNLVKEIESIVRNQDRSISAFLLACWQVLLARLAGISEVVVHTLFDCRSSKELQESIGLFAKYIPIYTNFEDDIRFREILEKISNSLGNHYPWQEYFIDKENSEKDSINSRLFPIGFDFEQWPGEQYAGGVRFSIEKKYVCTDWFKLKVSGIQANGYLNIEFHYDPTLYEKEQIQRIADEFETLLKSAVKGPEKLVSELDILSEIEKQQVLVEWNDTQTDYAQDACIHQLFEAQVERTPDAVAAVFEDKQLTYGELNRRGNQLAHHLRALGVGPEVIVGLYMERSLEMLVALLGILKAGGAYLPLNCANPQDRLTFMLEDAQVPVLLTQKRLTTQLPALGIKTICLDSEWEKINQNSEENLLREVTSENLAYVIYTSGSTGKPKGAMIQHRSAVNLATALNKAIYSHQRSPLRVSLNAPLSFDASVKQILQLLNGHTLYIVPEEVRRDSNELLSYLSRHALDVLDCTPSHLKLLLAAGLTQIPERVPAVVLIGGEPLDKATWKLLANSAQISFYNVYGPTECTVNASVCHVQTAPAQPTIGRPLANVQIYILDSHLQPVPIGVPGELHIGGAGLARGYLNRPELTAEKFINHPFSQEPGARLYKTGDLARYLPDGNIEFLGRIDYQVKVRGYRIELGEIERVLEQHPSVRQAVVLAREDEAGDKRLVAYIVPKQEQPSPADELRGFLKQKLPEYMVPNAFVFLDALPLTPNGKLDRRALPAPDQTRQGSEANFVVPRDDLELQLTKIWEKVLGIQPIGVMDNFFELGGHSLLVVALVAEIKKAFNKNLPLAAVFQAPTVSHLANILRQEGWSASSSSLAVIQAGGRKPPLFFIHVLGEGLEYCRNLARHLDPEQPIYGLAVGIMDEVSQNLVENLDTYYIKEMQMIQPNGPYFLAGIMCGGRVVYNMAEQLHAQGQKVELLALLGTLRDENTIKTLSVQDWVAAHWNNFSQIGHAYVLNKMKQNIQNVKSRLMSIYCKFYESMSRPLPQDYQDFAYRQGKSEGQRFVFAPQVYPERVTLFRAMEDIDFLEPDLGWSELAAGGLEIHDVPGDTFSMLQEPHVKVLGEKLRACIDRVQADDLAQIPPQH
ncbi:non-ribosomal peptide synthetase [Microseira wollei]|nr:non-ribosomal peptide synthetase [Microseira wollei]